MRASSRKHRIRSKKSPRMLIKIWGCRGSLPSPGPKTSYFGGNTSCVELRCGGETIILDAGSGIRELGQALMRDGAFRGSLIFSHYHWDHIMGLPFFTPAYIPSNSFKIYGEKKDGKGVQEVLSGQMQAPYFPVPMKAMKANMEFVDIGPDMIFQIGEVTVKTFRAYHPNGCLAFRIEYDGAVVTYATDTEHTNIMDANILKAAQGTDLFIYDTTYTEKEFNGIGGPSKKGWGHSTWEEAVKLSRDSGVKRLLLWHHDPAHTDAFVSRMEALSRKVFKETRAARDGMTIVL